LKYTLIYTELESLRETKQEYWQYYGKNREIKNVVAKILYKV